MFLLWSRLNIFLAERRFRLDGSNPVSTSSRLSTGCDQSPVWHPLTQRPSLSNVSAERGLKHGRGQEHDVVLRVSTSPRQSAD